MNSVFGVLEKHSQTETSFKSNFLPVKGDSSLTSCCVDVHISENKMVSQRNVSCPEAMDRLSCLVAAKVDRLSCLVAVNTGSWWQRIGARYEYASILKFFLTTQLSCSWSQYNLGMGKCLTQNYLVWNEFLTIWTVTHQHWLTKHHWTECRVT